MATISVDFNARDVDGRVRMNDPGARKSIEATGAKVGDWVWLSDGELRVGGRIEEAREGLRARVFWETLEDIIPEDDESRTPEQFRAAVEVFGRQIHSPSPNYRELLRVLPLLERALPPGEADANRARAAYAFGYPELALLAIDNALQADPKADEWALFRLNVLCEIDLERAARAADGIVANLRSPALLLVACTRVFGTIAQRLAGEEARQRYQSMVELAERIDGAPGRDALTPDLVALLHDSKGHALSRLGDRDRALLEFNEAIRENPEDWHPYAARGIEAYRFDRDQAVRDLLQAVSLGSLTFWPSYYLTHHSLQESEWEGVVKHADRALKLAPPPSVVANLLEWLGIAEYQRGGNVGVARNYLVKALQLTPDSDHLNANLRRLDRLAEDQQREDGGWEVVLNRQANATDIAVAA